MTNEQLAQTLDDHAHQLDLRHDNLYRINAYRHAADVLRHLPHELSDGFSKYGKKALQEIPGIGPSICLALENLLTKGRHSGFSEEALAVPHEDSIRAVHGIGPVLADHLQEELHIFSLADLRESVANGTIERLSVSKEVIRNIVNALKEHDALSELRKPFALEPTVPDLLALDQQYREWVAKDALFGESSEMTSVYVLRKSFHGWHFRCLFSQGSLAARLGKSEDWVTIYFNDGSAYGERTVETAESGPLSGQRVVRGREKECQQYYNEAKAFARAS